MFRKSDKFIGQNSTAPEELKFRSSRCDSFFGLSRMLEPTLICFCLSEALHTHMCVHVSECVYMDMGASARKMEGGDDKSRILGIVI